MMLFILLAFLLITNDAAVGDQTVEYVEAYVGEDVLLPCTCPVETKNLSWQRDERLVNAYPQDENMPIDDAYMSRTKLFQKRDRTNCSLLLRNVSQEDAGVYTCHALNEVVIGIWSRETFNFNLTVSENTSSISEGQRGGSKTAVSIGVPILVVVSILTLVLLTTLLIRRRRRTNTDTDIPAQQPMMTV